MTDSIKEYDSLISHMRMDENGIFIITLKDSNLPYNYKEISNHLSYILKHRIGNSHKVILDTRNSFSLPEDSTIRHFAEHNLKENRYAIVINSLAIKLMVNHAIFKTKVENTRIFKTYQLAYDWIIAE